MDVEITVDDTEVYDSLPSFKWEKYQRGYMGILNNAYNQSCNCGTKVLGDMSEITSSFEGGSYDDFIEYYYRVHDGKKRRRQAVKRMAENIIKRVRAVGGDVPDSKAVKWSNRYIHSMLVNSYRGFMDEARAIELVADELGEEWRVASSDEESDGIDGYIGDQSVQVKPLSYNDLDINSFDADLLVTYTYNDCKFTVSCVKSSQ
jgi:hypothetical protein